MLGPQHADDAFSHSVMSQCQRELRRRTGRRAVITCGSRGVLVEQKGCQRAGACLPAQGDGCVRLRRCVHLGHGERAVRGRPWQEAAELGNLRLRHHPKNRADGHFPPG